MKIFSQRGVCRVGDGGLGWVCGIGGLEVGAWLGGLSIRVGCVSVCHVGGGVVKGRRGGVAWERGREVER